MDAYEATKAVMSRIQNLDPENASKIMGYILIQDEGEKEIMRLAFVPDSILQCFVDQAKLRLGLCCSNFIQRPSQISIPNKAFHLSNPSSPALQRTSPRPFSYAAAVINNSSSSDQLPEDPLMSPSGRSDSVIFPNDDLLSPQPFHRRSCSVNDAAEGFGWRPCMYFARGFCKNGSACKFVHEGEGLEVANGLEELLRMKALHHRSLPLMPSPRPHHHFPFNQLLTDRNEFSTVGFCGSLSSSARQIYLTFPADSTFKEEDVSCYFSMFGPVQDVRIPYQQKRMFGFVTFIYPETVKLILAKGNPHFVCDSRVLVKPYKEKGKVAEKKQHLDLGLSGNDCREQMDLPFGSRMLSSTQEMLLRRKLEQEAELQHALELEGRRMMNLQLMDLKNQHLLQSIRSGIPILSPRLSMNQFIAASDSINSEDFDPAKSPGAEQRERSVYLTNNNNNNNARDKQENLDDDDLPESLEHILPDNLFASPKKSSAEQHTLFSQSSPSTHDNIHLQSCFVQIPRFSSKQESVGLT